MLHICSWNIACANSDELRQPLYTRLPAIGALLAEKEIDIFCVQEVRATGSLTDVDVMIQLQSFLPPGAWVFHLQAVHSGPTAFRRGIFWNTERVTKLQGQHIRVANYMIQKMLFLINGTPHAVAVFNCHAPMDRVEKNYYWSVLARHMHAYEGTAKIAVGDFNKFEEDLDLYHTVFDEFTDHIQDTTFTSFPGDYQPNTTKPWVSCLDSVLTLPDQKVETCIYPTTTEPRPSDHYLIQVKFCI